MSTKAKAKPPVAPPQTAAKAVGKPVQVPASAPPKKATSASPAKGTAKEVAKDVAKGAVKSAVKAPSKPAPVTAAKASAKATAEPSSKAKPVPAAPALAKVKQAPSAPAKAGAKAAAQAATSSSAASSVSAKRGTAVASGKSAAPQPPLASKPAAVSTGSPVLMPIGTASSGGIARAGRPSSRLVSLTVPSMAQTVASNAAKASYSQIIPSPMIAPAVPTSVNKDLKLANNWKTKSAEELTDAELLAMPDEEYMNDKQRAAFRHRLVQLKNEILASAGETTEHLREDTAVLPDPADRATIEEEHALELRTRDRERKLLKKIEQSIQRIDTDDYGFCDETGENIGVGRLLARPTATLSLEAQQRREMKQKMFGD